MNSRKKMPLKNKTGDRNTLPSNSCFYRHWKRSLKKNIVGKGENAVKQHFLLFPQCFLLHEGQILTI